MLFALVVYFVCLSACSSCLFCQSFCLSQAKLRFGYDAINTALCCVDACVYVYVYIVRLCVCVHVRVYVDAHARLHCLLSYVLYIELSP